MSKMVSPNEMQHAAKHFMLQGREPISKRDWELCANFWAVNLDRGLEVSTMPLLGLVLDCPLSKSELIAIALFQVNEKGKR